MVTLSHTSSVYAQQTQWIEVALPNERPLRVELAYTAPVRIRGLMFRQSLPEDYGMLFVMPEQRIHTFWMKNMLIPLDILFLSNDGTITSMVESVPPPSDEMENIPRVTGFGRYILEINAGGIAEHQLHIGDRLKFELPFALDSVY